MSTDDTLNKGQANNGKLAGLGLSFSGGGYRAAAYSLGTLSLLQDLGLMGNVKVMSGVSGGSLAVGAYLCGKAGAQPESEEKFDFYAKVFNPLIDELTSENLSINFVKPKAILQGKKIILYAADHTNAFMSRLLGRGQAAELGNTLITSMLGNQKLSPDYVFFNTTNISSLDLFRFGIQKSKDHDPVFALNRYFLTADENCKVADDLYQLAKKIPIGHSIASSYAFPFGFEPLIFPNDFFPAPMPNEKYPMSESLICDNKPYLAFLDGGLYDNLGLASVEDIRNFLNKPVNSDYQNNSIQQSDWASAIRYVIATDVDNIQPSVSAYKEAGLENAGDGAESGKTSMQIWWIISLKLFGIPLYIVGTVLCLVWKGISCVIKDLGSGELNPVKPSWTARLGLNANDFPPGSDSLNLLAIGRQFLWKFLSSSSPGEPIKALKTSLVDRRLGQLSPAFNGYLKRTRSLTYGFLQQLYEQTQHDPTMEPCSLIRNMIFELLPGPDADPDYTAKLITLPIKKFVDQNQRETISSIPPIRRKSRHARFIQDLLLCQSTSQASNSVATLAEQPCSHAEFAGKLFSHLIDEPDSNNDCLSHPLFSLCYEEIKTKGHLE